MSVVTLGSGIPQATSKIGDPEGFFLGKTIGTSASNVFIAPWRRTEVDQASAVVVLAGGLGSGKSGVMADFIYKSCEAGVQTIAVDPSGTMGKLCDMPEFEGRSRKVDVMSAEDGELNPYAIVPDPIRDHFDTEEEWKKEIAVTKSVRTLLAQNTMWWALPDSFKGELRAKVALDEAMKAVPPVHTSSLQAVVDNLASVGLGNPDAKGHRPVVDAELHAIAGYMKTHYEGLRETPQGRLFIPKGQHRWSNNVGPLLSVFSLQGLALPDKNMDNLDLDEQLSVVVLNLTAWLASRAIYAGDKNARKLLSFDETYALAAFPSGRRLIAKATLDSRKWNVCVMVAAQNPSVLLDLELENTATTIFGGRLEGAKAQADMMNFYPGTPKGVGYEEIFGTLSPGTEDGQPGPRDFVLRIKDVTDIVRVCGFEAHPNFEKAAITTADKTKARGRMARDAADAADIAAGGRAPVFGDDLDELGRIA
jgi:hypothetical protein